MINDCSNVCKQKNYKTIIEKNQCIEKCESDYEYIYEHNNICYKQCPEGFYGSNNKCNKCYEKCKSCIESGNNINNNCLKCLGENMILLNDFNKNNCYKECPFYYYFDENEEYFCTNSSKCPENYKILLQW